MQAGGAPQRRPSLSMEGDQSGTNVPRRVAPPTPRHTHPNGRPAIERCVAQARTAQLHRVDPLLTGCRGIAWEEFLRDLLVPLGTHGPTDKRENSDNNQRDEHHNQRILDQPLGRDATFDQCANPR